MARRTEPFETAQSILRIFVADLPADFFGEALHLRANGVILHEIEERLRIDERVFVHFLLQKVAKLRKFQERFPSAISDPLPVFFESFFPRQLFFWVIFRTLRIQSYSELFHATQKRAAQLLAKGVDFREQGCRRVLWLTVFSGCHFALFQKGNSRFTRRLHSGR